MSSGDSVGGGGGGGWGENFICVMNTEHNFARDGR